MHFSLTYHSIARREHILFYGTEKRKSTSKSALTRLTRQAGARTKVEIADTTVKVEGSKSKIKTSGMSTKTPPNRFQIFIQID